MGFNISDILTGGIDKIIDSVGNAADKIFTSEQERKLLQNELEEIRANAKQQSETNTIALEKEITSRWKIDSENVVTRLIRPMTVFWSYFLFTIVILFDGNIGEFHINQAYVPMLETILVTVTIAYFSGRTVDKWRQNDSRNNGLDMF